MFLAIPLLAILKIIFDRIDTLEPWGYLMGDHLPKGFIWRKKKPMETKNTSTAGQIEITSTEKTRANDIVATSMSESNSN